jgi:hypothetical protein
MRVLLRHRPTKLYYVRFNERSGINDFSQAPECALDFGDLGSASRLVLQEQLPDMEIALQYEICDAEVTVPVLPEWCRFAKPVAHPAGGPAAKAET